MYFVKKYNYLHFLEFIKINKTKIQKENKQKPKWLTTFLKNVFKTSSVLNHK